MKARDQIVLISENEELYKPFERALGHLENTDLLHNMQEDNNRNAIIIYAADRESLYKYLWNEIRLIHKKKNPVIVLSYHELDSSVDIRDKVFEKLWNSHAYFQIPFNLKELLNSFKQLTPLKNLRETIKDYADNPGLTGIAFHELRGLLGSREDLSPVERRDKTCSLLSQIKKILMVMDGKEEILKCIDNIALQVKQSSMSEEERNKFILLIQELAKEDFNE